MKYRKKPEIVEATQLPDGWWRLIDDAGRELALSDRDFRLYYEPVPDAPPADPPVGTCWIDTIDPVGSEAFVMGEGGRLIWRNRHGRTRQAVSTIRAILEEERRGLLIRVPDSPATEGENRHG